MKLLFLLLGALGGGALGVLAPLLALGQWQPQMSYEFALTYLLAGLGLGLALGGYLGLKVFHRRSP